MLWLEGGPGISSFFSLFNQHGPLTLDAALHPVPRDYSWAKMLNMLYIDGPVGAGEWSGGTAWCLPWFSVSYSGIWNDSDDHCHSISSGITYT